MPGAGRFALGPLSEVAASTHTWAELAPHAPPGPLAAVTAHERVVRGEDLRRIALFDLLVNNADRKAGHVFPDAQDNVWAIDHGICFNTQPKLRTVVWDFGGEAIPKRLLADMARLAKEVPDGLRPLLTDEECEAVVRRARAVVRQGRFPSPGPERRAYPWPLV